MEESYRVGRDAPKHLQEHVEALAKAGLLIGARRSHCLLTGGIAAAPSPWLAVDIEIRPLSITKVTDDAGVQIWPPNEAPTTGSDLPDN